MNFDYKDNIFLFKFFNEKNKQKNIRIKKGYIIDKRNALSI